MLHLSSSIEFSVSSALCKKKRSVPSIHLKYSLLTKDKKSIAFQKYRRINLLKSRDTPT